MCRCPGDFDFPLLTFVPFLTFTLRLAVDSAGQVNSGPLDDNPAKRADSDSRSELAGSLTTGVSTG